MSRFLAVLGGWARKVLQTAWQSPVDHPREAVLIFCARMVVLFSSATIAITLALIAVLIGKMT